MIDTPTAVLASRAGGGTPSQQLPRIVRMHAFPAAVCTCIVRMHAFPRAFLPRIVRTDAFHRSNSSFEGGCVHPPSKLLPCIVFGIVKKSACETYPRRTIIELFSALLGDPLFGTDSRGSRSNSSFEGRPAAILPRIVRMHAFCRAILPCIVRMHAFPAAILPTVCGACGARHMILLRLDLAALGFPVTKVPPDLIGAILVFCCLKI